MGISHEWDGTLSTSGFYTSAKFLSDKWKGTYPLLPPWTWVSCSRLFGVDKHEIQGYLSLEHFSCPKSAEGDTGGGSSGKEEPTCSLKEELMDDATLVQNYDQDLHFYDLHIVLHNSYRVPVLYFRGYHCDGQPLAQDEIEEGLPSLSSKVMKDSRWTFLTIEEHPFLKRPWYVLHPCGTSEWMKLLLTSAASELEWEDIVQQYLLSWLSVAGQVVGLVVPLELFRSHAEYYGQPLAQDEIEEGLPSLSSKVMKDSRWTFLTIEEHPFLKRPWYVLHPCGTSEWMKLLLTSAASEHEWEDIVQQYLLSWLSVAGQVVGLVVPLELFRSHAEYCKINC